MTDIRNVVYDLLAHFQNSLAVYHLIPIHFSKSVTFLWYIFNDMINTKS